MRRKRIRVKDKKLQEFFKKGGRKEAKKDFTELLKRAAKTKLEIRN
jgi:hypothetical protein